MLQKFEPVNDLERLILQAKAGSKTMNEVATALVQSSLYVSSHQPVQRDGSGYDALVLGPDDDPMVAVFTSEARPVLHREKAGYVMLISGARFFQRLASGFGVIINPGYDAQLVLQQNGVEAIKKQLSRPN